MTWPIPLGSNQTIVSEVRWISDRESRTHRILFPGETGSENGWLPQRNTSWIVTLVVVLDSPDWSFSPSCHGRTTEPQRNTPIGTFKYYLEQIQRLSNVTSNQRIQRRYEKVDMSLVLTDIVHIPVSLKREGRTSKLRHLYLTVICLSSSFLYLSIITRIRTLSMF